MNTSRAYLFASWNLDLWLDDFYKVAGLIIFSCQSSLA